MPMVRKDSQEWYSKEHLKGKDPVQELAKEEQETWETQEPWDTEA